MKIQVLVSTMNQNDISIYKKMNINTNALIINQCNFYDKKIYNINDKIIEMYSNKDRGLSKSRNLAINSAQGDICIIADDDVIYNENYKTIILEEYKEHPDADIIAFQVPTTNISRKQKEVNRTKNVRYINSGKIASFQITFKLESIKSKNIKFDEKFGAGSKYSCGEESIWLFDCLNKGLKIIQSEKEIGIVTHEESTWFNGFNDKFFRDKGAIFTRMSNRYSLLWILQYAIRKKKLYKEEQNIAKAIKLMLQGRQEYLRE